MAQRETWGSRTGFIMAAVGSAIGLGNIWRFPYMAYENGGGAFLIPYFVAMICAGIPIIILEFGLGHRFRASAPKVFASILRPWEALGWWQVGVVFVISCYYAVVIAWAARYCLLAPTLGWGSDPKDFFFNGFLHVTDSATRLGGVNWPILACLLAVWAVIFATVFTGVQKGIERLSKVFMPLLFVLVLVFLVRGVTLPGAAEGVNWLFRPNFSAIADARVWAAAFGQIFYSLSVGYAIMISYSSYLPEDSDISNNGCITVFINCGFSILAGIMIFAILGNMAHTQNVGIADVAGEGVGLAFVTLPMATNLMPLPGLFGTLFFVALVVAGLSSLMSMTEAIVAALMDKLDARRGPVAVGACAALVAGGVVFAMDGGLYALDIVDHFFNNYGVLLGALAELVLLGWLCDLASMRRHVNRTSEFRVGRMWMVCLKFIAPVMLAAITSMNLAEDLEGTYGGYPASAALIYGWLLLLACLAVSLALPATKAAFADLAGVTCDIRKQGGGR